MYGTKYGIIFQAKARFLIGFLILCFSIPLKLATDLMSYLFGIAVPSSTQLCIPLAALFFLLFPKLKAEAKVFMLLFSIFLFSFFLVFVLNVIFRHVDGYGEWVFNTLSVSLLLYVIYFCSGYFYYMWEKNSVIIFLITFCLSSLLIVFSQFYIGDVWQKLNESGAYLRISDLFAFISLLLVAKIGEVIYRAFMVVVSIVVLFYLGSRSSLIFYIAALAFYYLFLILAGRLKIRFVFFHCLLIFFLFLMFLLDERLLSIISEEFLGGRIGYTFLQSDTFGGLDARQHYLASGIERILENPIGGNFYHRFHGDGGAGGYIHNVLFLWDDFGFFVFFSFVLLALYSLIVVIKNQSISYLFLPFAFCLLSMCFARAYAFPYVFYIAGSVFAFLNKKD